VIAVNRAPVLLGAGARWLDNLGTDPIRLGNSRVIPCQRIAHLHYPVPPRSKATGT
jgi:hypothetical protein